MNSRVYQFISITTIKHIVTITLTSLFNDYKRKTGDFENAAHSTKVHL